MIVRAILFFAFSSLHKVNIFKLKKAKKRIALTINTLEWKMLILIALYLIAAELMFVLMSKFQILVTIRWIRWWENMFQMILSEKIYLWKLMIGSANYSSKICRSLISTKSGCTWLQCRLEIFCCGTLFLRNFRSKKFTREEPKGHFHCNMTSNINFGGCSCACFASKYVNTN